VLGLAVVATLAALHLGQPGEAFAQSDTPSDIRKGAPPVVLILLDTSGSMESTDEEALYPCCVPRGAGSVYNEACLTDRDCSFAGQSCIGGLCAPRQCPNFLWSSSPSQILASGYRFEKTRAIQAKEVLTGRWDSYWCEEVDRDSGPGSDPFALDNAYPVPHFEPRGAQRYNESGLIFLNRDVVRFGYFPFDSAEAGGDTWSYSTPIETAAWNLGVRDLVNIHDANRLAGGSISVGDMSDAEEGRLIASTIEQSIAEFIPFEATPIAAMLSDVNHYLSVNDDITTDTFASCRPKEVILVTDGAPTFDECAICTPPDCPSRCDAQYPYKTSLEEVAELMNAHPDARVHVIGFNVSASDQASCLGVAQAVALQPAVGAVPNVACIHQLAMLGQTDADPSDPNVAAYIADGQLGLTKELTKVLNGIVDGISARTATRATTRVAFRDTKAGQYRFSAAFSLDNDHHLWKGLLERATFSCGGIQGDVVDFADALNARDPSTRQIYTAIRDPRAARPVERNYYTEGGRRLLKFNTSNLAARIPNLNQADLNQMFRADTLPGVDFATIQAVVDGSDPDRTDRKLGGVFHASPVIVGGPELNIEVPGYQRFAAAVNPLEAPRKTAIAQGSKDGLLHYFDGESDDGNELWAFLPEELHGKLYLQKATHIYGVDAAPVVRDVRMYRGAANAPDGYVDPVSGVDAVSFNDIWNTVLVGGLRAGGRAYYALDVSVPETPRHLWELNPSTEARKLDNAIGSDDPFRNYPGLDFAIREPMIGLSYGDAGLGTVVTKEGVDLIEKGIAILPGGLPSDPANPGNEGRAIYVIELATGKIIRRFTHFTHFANDGARRIDAPVTGSVAVYNDFPGSFLTRAFVGDAKGRVLRIDLRDSNPSNWFVDIFHDSGTNRPIFIKPSAATGPSDEIVMLYGTGDTDHLEVRDEQNVVFSLSEKIGYNANGTIDNDNITATVNWKLTLDRGEKLTGEPIIFDRVAYFPTFMPDKSDVCSFGRGRIYAVDYVGDDPASEDDVISQFTADDVANNASAVVTLDASAQRYVELEPNSVIFGLEIASRPSCTPDTPDNLDSDSAAASRVDPANSTNDLELIVQTGRSQSTTAPPGNASKINQVSFKLDRPPTAAFATSWAQVLN